MCRDSWYSVPTTSVISSTVRSPSFFGAPRALNLETLTFTFHASESKTPDAPAPDTNVHAKNGTPPAVELDRDGPHGGVDEVLGRHARLRLPQLDGRVDVLVLGRGDVQAVGATLHDRRGRDDGRPAVEQPTHHVVAGGPLQLEDRLRRGAVPFGLGDVPATRHPPGRARSPLGTLGAAMRCDRTVESLRRHLS